MLVNIKKEDSKRALDFIRKSRRDGLTEVLIRVYSHNYSMNIRTSKFAGDEKREITINYETKYKEDYDEIVFDLTTDHLAVEYILSEECTMDLYRNNLSGIHFEDEVGNIRDTKYFIDTVCLYKRNKKGFKEKMIKIDQIGYDEQYRMIKL